jgi:hypothetical protein
MQGVSSTLSSVVSSVKFPEQCTAQSQPTSGVSSTLSSEVISEAKTSKEFTSDDLKKYVQYIIDNVPTKGNVSDGYKAISREIGISENKGLKIKGYLENKGYLVVKGNKTLIIKDLNSVEFS